MQDSDLQSDFEMIEYLSKLDLISYPSIALKKKNSKFDLAESSSGEYHLLSSLIGLMSTIEDNSLVFIDEPEVSLHPNWQMKYMNYLNEIFKGKKSCHFVIATHSHFIISDLVGSNSQVIGLKKEEKLKPIQFENNTFGWSAEDVLYNIFDVPSTRNFYVAKEIGEILTELSDSKHSVDKIKGSRKSLEKIKNGLKNEDPLKSLITKVQKEFLYE